MLSGNFNKLRHLNRALRINNHIRLFWYFAAVCPDARPPVIINSMADFFCRSQVQIITTNNVFKLCENHGAEK
jgi:hypothetical protein